jgi:hypothetical protein
MCLPSGTHPVTIEGKFDKWFAMIVKQALSSSSSSQQAD